MPIKVEELNGIVVNMRVDDYRSLRAAAYRDGTMSKVMPEYKYKFQQEEYVRGRKADELLRKELEQGLR